jgi:hypothetical protein
MSSTRDDDLERDAQLDDEDAGLVGGGGPAETLPEMPGPDDEELHRPDTDHGEL